MRILTFLLLLSGAGSLGAQTPSPKTPIFRHIVLSRDTAELGRPLGALGRFARTPTDSIVSVPLGEFGGTDAIQLHRRASGEVTMMLFLYGTRHSMTVLRDGYIEDFGPPQAAGIDTVAGIERRSWIWRDRRTVFQVSAFATPLDGISGTAMMRDLVPASP